MNNKPILVIVGIILVGVAILLFAAQGPNEDSASRNNVTVIDGKQFIEIEARGGYRPRISLVGADIPTVIKMKTGGTFDCSSALVIPALNYQANLPLSGETLIEVPPQKTGTVLRGLCSMGMYSFTISFN